ENQPKLAAAGHPAHVAFVAMSAGVGVAEAGPFKEQGNFWRGGAWQQGWFDYFYEAMHQDWPQLPADISDEERQRLSARFTLENSGWGVDPKRYDETRMHLPMIDIMEELDAPRNEVAEYLTRGPSHPDWSENRISEGEAIEIPGFWAEALYDISTRSTVAYFNWNHGEGLKIGRDNQTLRLTQGGHCSFGRETEDWSIGDLALGDARFPLHDEIVAWFSHWMPVDRDATRQAAVDTGVKAYVADGIWIKGDTLSYGGGDVWSLAANGAFGAAADMSAELTYTYDPADPVPSMGGEIGGTGTDHDDGAFDQTPLEARQDVLVFTSDPLEASIDFVGYANVSLSVSSDRPDTDFTVKLMDVYPDGRAYNIGDTILRMRHRDGVDKSVFMEAGQRYDVELPPILLTRRIEAGHSLRVHVSSSNFPNYSRNLNTAQDPYTSTDQEIATNTIYVGGDAVSRIEWPAPLR
ncbi:MAG: CocE/NonD family hydrolase, partial [Pseudomonadota bacterium]